MIHRVERLDDGRIAAYTHVGEPAYLRDHGLFVAEGRLVVSRLIAAQRFTIHSILLTSAAHAALAEVLPADVPVYVAEQSIVNGVTGFNFHRGCLALASRPAEGSVNAFLDMWSVLALEGVGNPDNVGGIFRVAAAFAVDGVLLDPTSADPLYRKAIRTSMGAALQVPFARASAWLPTLARFKAAGFRILALTPRYDAQPVDELQTPAPDRTLLLAGAEGPGLSAEALAAADAWVRIPMTERVDSLNVTVAVGIALSRLFP